MGGSYKNSVLQLAGENKQLKLKKKKINACLYTSNLHFFKQGKQQMQLKIGHTYAD